MQYVTLDLQTVPGKVVLDWDEFAALCRAVTPSRPEPITDVTAHRLCVAVNMADFITDQSRWASSLLGRAVESPMNLADLTEAEAQILLADIWQYREESTR